MSQGATSAEERAARHERPAARGLFARTARRARRLLAGFAHGLAWCAALVLLLTVLGGGIQFRVLGIELRSTGYLRPLVLFAALTAIGLAIDARGGLAATATGRTARALGRLWRATGRRVGGRVADVALVALVLFHGWKRVDQHLLRAEAAELERAADYAGAAERYREARSWMCWIDADLVSDEGACLYKAGRFEESVAVLQPRFEAGEALSDWGYRGLWKSLGELGRHDEAIAVVRHAMSVFAHLGTEGTGTLALLERAAHAAGKPPGRVRFVLDPALAQGAEALWLSGNWTDGGRPSEVHGWEPVPLSRGAEGWTMEVELALSQELPYVALVRDTPEPFATPALAWAQFWVPVPEDGASAAPLEVELLRAPEPRGVPAPVARTGAADGRRRTLVVWPDCGSWFALNLYAHAGYLPNAARLLRGGARFEMLSTHPPFTSTAYVRMVEMAPGGGAESSYSKLDVVLLQLKGLPWIDGLVPDSIVHAGDRRTIFDVLGEHGHSSANLVFSDDYLMAAGDEGGGHVHEPGEIGDDALPAEVVMRECLGFDPTDDPERAAAIADEAYFLYCTQNTEEKAERGLSVWRENAADFLLLRFPAVDLVSHAYWSTIADEPLQGPILETYRHLDRLLGELAAELDADDTLILVSDHGIYSTLHHHRSCVLVMEGPGLAPGSAFGTIPIGHFPCAVLSRFGIEEGKERLTAEELEVFYGG